ncbi:uncharacterized protein LOC130494925 [Raphanus sativus]|uniref:Uncharacterized protein LOC130494925 n=1 Tax=Raphanus sativus TaxID=3726 RepID=A0A9W3BR97_RAPSA|nr:uncharacterized protein LOC130494925 [Raphanus sativus]
MVKAWILNSVTKQIYGSILRFNDASEIWKDLATRFRITNLPRSYHLTQQIWSLHQGSLDLSTYYTKLKTLWDELDGADCVKTCQTCDCCKAMYNKAEHAKIIKLLAGLNDSYSNVRSQIIMKKNVPDLAEVYNLLDQDHSQRSFNPIPNASAFQVTTETTAASVNATQTLPSNRSNRPLCSHCGYSGHTMDKCYKIHGFSPGFKSKRVAAAEKQATPVKPVVANMTHTDLTNDSIATGMMNTLSKDQIQGVIEYFNAQLQLSSDPKTQVASTSGGSITTLPGMTLSTNTLYFVGVLRATGNVLSSVSWIIDSGATHHVCHDRSKFLTLSDTLNQSVSLPNGLGVQIVGTGQVKINESLILNNVLYIPDFRLNLISDLTRGLMIGQGEEVANLYILDEASVGELSTRPSSFCASVVLDSALWHHRLGHPSIQKIDSISNVLGISQRNKTSFHCAICPLAKQKHLSFPSQNNMSIKPFDLLHIDTLGPFSVTSNEGYIYFLTIVDDHTRVTWIYLMRTKDEVLTLFPEFLKMVETQYKTTVKGVRSDNAPELRFTDLYKAKGI